MKLPGTHLLAVARLVVDPAAVAHVLEPLVADWQREWLTAGSAWRAIVRVRGVVAFVCSATYCCAIDTMPSDVRRRAWIALASFVGVSSLLLLVPYRLVPATAAAYLLPSTLALTLPFGILPLAMLLGTSTDRGSSRRHLLRFAIAVALLAFALHNWITPYANQAFREHLVFRAAERAGRVAYYQPPARGVRELTLPELYTVSLPAFGIMASSEARVREEINRRLALPLVPLLLAILGWSLGSVSNAAGAMRLTGWWLFVCLTFGFAPDLGMTLERSWNVPRLFGVWVPLVLWAAASLVLLRWNARVTPIDSGRSEDLPYGCEKP
jgi:hypothetical protein